MISVLTRWRRSYTRVYERDLAGHISFLPLGPFLLVWCWLRLRDEGDGRSIGPWEGGVASAELLWSMPSWRVFVHPSLSKKVGVQSTTPPHSFCMFFDIVFARLQPKRWFRQHLASISIFARAIASTTLLFTEFLSRPGRSKWCGGGDMDMPYLRAAKHFSDSGIQHCSPLLEKSSSHHGTSQLAGTPTIRMSVSVRACR